MYLKSIVKVLPIVIVFSLIECVLIQNEKPDKNLRKTGIGLFIPDSEKSHKYFEYLKKKRCFDSDINILGYETFDISRLQSYTSHADSLRISRKDFSKEQKLKYSDHDGSLFLFFPHADPVEINIDSAFNFQLNGDKLFKITGHTKGESFSNVELSIKRNILNGHVHNYKPDRILLISTIDTGVVVCIDHPAFDSILTHEPTLR